jgi:hypothetical protein
MGKSNYALISALYESKTRGLYSDIYFPIIKYVVVKLYVDSTNSDHYSTAEAVRDKIHELFGIYIPYVVIIMTLRKLEARHSSNIEIKLYEEGKAFQILTAYFDEEENTFEEKEHDYNVHITEIEYEYQRFLKLEKIAGEDVCFIDFITNNTDNILGYFESQSKEQVEDKYASIIFFLEYLQRENKALFMVANQLFWSSVVSAFLQSERPQVDKNDNGVKSEYYLDTSVIMGLLGLSTLENELCVQEVKNVIISSGGVMKVHPLTLEEVKTILLSVETNGAYAGTSIASAYVRKNLSTTKVSHIRLNLTKSVEGLGVQIFPNAMRDAIHEAMYKYHGKPVIHELAELRSHIEIEYGNDNFREVHDIFMDDYIRNLRKQHCDRTDIYFLTSNRDLIEFCKAKHQGDSVMISPGSVILELWMHSTKPSDISSGMLTETMAKCLDLHRAKVRGKMQKVSKIFNQNKQALTPEVYKDYLGRIYRRDLEMLQAVDADPEVDTIQYMQVIKDAAEKDSINFEHTVTTGANENARLTEEVATKSQELERTQEESQQKSQEIGNLSAQYSELSSQKDMFKESLDKAQEALDNVRIQAEEERKSKVAALDKITYYQKRDNLTENITKMKASLKPYEDDRKKSFCNWQPHAVFALGILLILCFVVVFFVNKFTNHHVNQWTPYSVLIIVGCMLIPLGVHINTNECKNRRRDKAYAKWQTKAGNEMYAKLKELIAKDEASLNNCNNKLNPDS